MGMTIDKAIDIMEHYKEYGFVSQANGRNKAIETMRKYQKIERIINNWKDATLKDVDVLYAFHKIKKVVEDGKFD